MPDWNTLKNLPLTPAFQRMTYQEQLQLRAELATTLMQQTPEITQLEPQDQARIYKDLVMRPPALEDVGFPGITAPVVNVLKNVQQDPKLMTQLNERMMKFFKGEDPSNALGVFGPGPLLGRVQQFLMGVKEGAGLIDGARDLVRRAVGMDADVSNEGKILEWTRMLHEEAYGNDALSSILPTVGAIAGFAAEMSIPMGKVAGTVTKPAGISKLLVKGASKIPTFAKMLRTGKLGSLVLRAGADAVTSGMLGAAYENVKDLIQGKMKDRSFEDIAKKSAAYFGDGMLWAMVFNGAFGAFRALKGGAKALRYTFIGVPGAHGEKLALKEALKTEYNNLFSAAITGKNISPMTWEKFGDPQFTTFMNNTVRIPALLKNIERPQIDDVIRVVGIASEAPVGGRGLTQGFNMTKDPDGVWKAFGTMDKKLHGSFASDDLAFKFLVDQNALLPGADVKNLSALGTASGKIQLTQKIKYFFPEGVSDARIKTMAGVIAPMGGSFKPDNVQAYAKEFLRGNGAKPELFNGVRAIKDAGNVKLLLGNTQVATIPFSVTNPKAEIGAITSLTENLSRLLPEKATTREASKMFLEQYQKSISGSAIHYTPSWIFDTIQNDFGGTVEQVGAGYRVQFPDGKMWKPENIQDLGNRVLLEKMLDEKTFKTYLGAYEGASLRKTRDGFEIAKKNAYGHQEVVARGATIEQILNEHTALLPKIPADFGPKFTFVDEGAKAGVIYEQKVAFGTAQTLLKELDKFYDVRKAARTSTLFGGKLKFDSVTKEFEVFLPELNYSQTFKDINAATRFLHRGAGDFEVLRTAANRKLWQVDVTANKWILYGKDDAGKTVTKAFRNADEVRGFLREAPNPVGHGAPELTGIEEEFFKDLKEIPDLSTGDPFYRAPDVGDAIPQLGPGWMVQQALRPVENQLLGAIKTSGEPAKELIKFYRRIEAARGIFSSMDAEANEVIQGIFKGHTRKSREGIRLLLQNNLDDARVGQLLRDLNLGPEHLAAARKAREILNTAFKDFRINPDDFLQNYLPRMRQFTHTADVSKFLDSDLEHFLSSELRDIGGSASDLTASFRYSRISDMVAFLQETDPQKLLMKYTATGLREKLFGPIMDDLRKWAATNRGKVDPALTMYFAHYLQEFLGVPTNYSDKALKILTERAYQKLGKGSPSGTLVDKVIRWGYGAYLGFRPFTAIRNLTQPFQTLGWRIGNKHVFDAMEQVVNDKGGKLFRRLVEEGVIPRDHPFYAAEDFLGKFGNKAKQVMNELPTLWIKQGDNYNRIVSYVATTNAFDKAYMRFRAGDLNIDGLMREARMWNLPVDLFERSKEMLTAGKFKQARALFAHTLTDESMFVYRKGRMPLPFSGTMGKVFGQFGSFFVNNVQNIRNAFARAPGIEKAKLFARMAGNLTALSGMFAAAGMKISDFIPGPITFSGGPSWDLLHGVLQAMSPGAYQGREARAKLFAWHSDKSLPLGGRWDIEEFFSSGIASNVIPGSLEYRSIKRGLEFLNKGDIYRAMLAFTSAPIAKRDDWPQGIIRSATGGVLPP
jgi:hypothetical protein